MQRVKQAAFGSHYMPTCTNARSPNNAVWVPTLTPLLAPPGPRGGNPWGPCKGAPKLPSLEVGRREGEDHLRVGGRVHGA
eukprot:3412718-Alexandrium_andersonii.AAC.1